MQYSLPIDVIIFLIRSDLASAFEVLEYKFGNQRPPCSKIIAFHSRLLPKVQFRYNKVSIGFETQYKFLTKALNCELPF